MADIIWLASVRNRQECSKSRNEGAAREATTAITARTVSNSISEKALNLRGHETAIIMGESY